MRKFLVFPDEDRYELSPISIKEFILMDLWRGDWDLDYKFFLQKNNLHDVDEFDMSGEEYRWKRPRVVLESGDTEFNINLDYENKYYNE